LTIVEMVTNYYKVNWTLRGTARRKYSRWSKGAAD